jgi:D-alanyl-lipoteichoic acid acyltransferase DltB (MBOAT superfamily)
MQNMLIIVAGLIFYGWWDWRFLFLLLFSSTVDFTVGILLSKQDDARKRKMLLSISFIGNLGLLGFFKYYNFFMSNFVEAFSLFGMKINPGSLKVILPVGISFYTFQTLSYAIDVYRRDLKATKSFVDFLAFVSFFPQLVAGPIERATNLLPQFYKERKFDYAQAVDGTRQILWGLFKKVVIADNCAEFANIIFNNSSAYSGSALVLGAIFFTIQIYGDFSGYSDIAIGTAKLFGFNLMRNFAFPYFSRDIAEFWRRWHISLSTWFRDYLYIPLGGSRGSLAKKIRNTFIIFIVSGFWHGANWTFLAWGALHAIFFLPLLLSKNNRNHLDIIAKGRALPSIKELFSMISTFAMTVFAWIFFRADNIHAAIAYIGGIFSKSLLSAPKFPGMQRASTLAILAAIFFIIEWMGRDGQYALSNLQTRWNKPLRYAIYYAIIFAMISFGGKEQQFIYFQF